MRPRTARILAATISVLSLVSVIASIPVGLSARAKIDRAPDIVIVGDPDAPRMHEVLEQLRQEQAAGGEIAATTADYNLFFALLLLLLFAWLGVGLLIVWRQPGNWAGWIFLLTGAPFPLLTLAQALVIHGVKADPGSVPLVGLWATLGEYALYPIALLPLLFLLYPDGHPPSPRWRWAVRGLVGGTGIAILGFLFRPGPFNNWIEDGILYENPFGIDALATIGPAVITVGAMIALPSGFSTVIAVRQRFKRATGEERQQMRWLAFVASLAGVFFVLQWVLGLIAEMFFGNEGNVPVFEVLFGLTAFTIVVGVPAAYLVAIFRHGLWNLDIVVKKTVQYVVLVIATIVIAGLIIVPLPFFVVGIDREIVPGVIVGVVLAGVVAALRVPARRIANRAVYGRRATPYEVLSEFAERMGGTYSTDDVLPRMAQLLGEATGARATRVWLRVGTVMRPEASWPRDAPLAGDVPSPGTALPDLGDDRAFDVRHQGELLGALTITEAPDEPITEAKAKLARDMAAQAGLVLRNVRLIEDLRDSRRRIVSAQDERAKRLERDIHDGAQQQLVALAVKLRLADGLVERDPPKARALLAELQTQAGETLEDLRDLARGIYPPLLADKGLAPALESQARRSPLPVVIEPDGVGRYGPDVESAVYFCCLEALNNAAKYAEASTAEIRLTHTGGELRFEVLDDGRGFDVGRTGYGTGLQGMADRLDAIDGTLLVVSAPGEGTSVLGRIPIEGVAP
ncbi:MAG TPA: sensor histidine kinase [Actinomycetota bacterium]